MRLPIALPLGVAAMLVTGGCADANDAQLAAEYSLLDETAGRLREDFNRAIGSVRLLFVVDPICPGCLRGLDDVNRALLATTSDRRLQTFVVHVPVLGAEAKDIGPASSLLQNPHVKHYWNPGGEFGRQLSEAVGLRQGDELVYAWDVWLVYGPTATWDDVLPPEPELLMHQLRALQGHAEFRRLDADVFAREVHQLLARQSASAARH